MSFIDFFEKIQNKPRVVRVQILWAFVLVSSFFVVSFWVVSLKYSVTDVNLSGAVEEVSQTKEKIIKETPSLMEALKASIGAFFEDDTGEEKIESEPSVQEGGSEKVKLMKLPMSR